MIYTIHDRKDLVDSIGTIENSIKLIQGKDCLNSITGTLSKDCLQNLIYLISNKDNNIDNALLRMIVRSFLISESISSGSAELSIVFLSYYLNNFKKFKSRKERLSRIKSLREEIIQSCKILEKRIKKASIEDLRLIVKGMDFSEEINKILDKLILNGDINTAYDVSQSSSSKSYYENNSGHELKIKIPQVDLIKSGTWKRNSTRAILIDGIIESVSQIHHILEKSSSTNEPMIIFCRKASEEVRKTVNLNFARDTIDLLMIETGFDIEYHHIFEDFSVAFNCDYVNINMGDTISSKMEKLVFTLDDVLAVNTSINLRVDNVQKEKIFRYIDDIKDIKNSIKHENIKSEELINIVKSIDNRIKFLSSNRVDIKIGKHDIDNDPYLISKVDGFFRSFTDIGSTGVIDLKNCDDIQSDIISAILTNSNHPIVTQRQIFQSLVTSFKIYETLTKAEKIFTIDKN